MDGYEIKHKHIRKIGGCESNLCGAFTLQQVPQGDIGDDTRSVGHGCHVHGAGAIGADEEKPLLQEEVIRLPGACSY